MKSLSFLLLILLFGIFSSPNILAQTPISAQEIEEQLRSRGVSQEELDIFLESRGIQESDLENMAPEELIELNNEFDIFLTNLRKEKKEDVKQADMNPMVENANEENSIPVEKEIQQVVVDVEASVDRFGDQLFTNGNFALQTGVGLVPGTYILDVGDQISISIFGYSQVDGIYPINEDGAIVYANGDRRTLVAGLTLNEAREKLRRVFRRSYNFTDGEFNVQVSGARTISVNIYGEVNRSGGYIMSAVNSPVNAIAASGGITDNGSYRNITLLKANGSTFPIDLYGFLADPDKLPKVGLSDNDVIHIPSAGKLVNLEGSVKRPLEYEMKDNETLEDLINFAGGFNINANKSSIQITRFVGAELVVIDVNYNNIGEKRTSLRNGDIITVKELNSELTNAIVVKGEVNNQGRIALSEGMRLKDLLDKLVFNSFSRTDIALIQRKEVDGSIKLIKVNLDSVMSDINSSDNLALQAQDELLIWRKSRFIDSSSKIVIDGAIKVPGNYPYDSKGTLLSDVILFAGGLRRDASNVGMVFRKDPLNQNKIQYLRFNPLKINEQANDFLLMPFDSILVYENYSISDNYQVEISGSVKKPGSYQYGPGMSVKDLVVLADGFRLSALTDKIEVSRVIIENNKATEIRVATVSMNADLSLSEDSNYLLQPFDKVFVRSVPEFELQNVVSLSGEVRYPGKYVLEDKNEKLSSVIKRAGGLTDEAFIQGAQLDRSVDNVGRIIMDLEQAMKSNNSKYNYILKNGDNIVIPKKEDIVTIRSNTLYRRNTTLKSEDGAIENALSVAYFPGKSALYYINEFGGGFGETSDRKNVVVEHANGEVSRTINYGLWNAYPKVKKGSVIIIPEKPIKDESEKDDEKVDWTKLLNDSVAQAMSILTLLLLVERL